MKDQRALLHKCMHAEIPVFVLCGSDHLALRTLEFYASLAKEECSQDFCEDLQLLINDFKKFQEEEPEKVKIPD